MSSKRTLIARFDVWYGNLFEFFIHIPLLLSPTDTRESKLHAAAQRAGLSICCPIQYLDLPICVGHQPDGEPVVEIKQWPFLLPSDLASWINSYAKPFPCRLNHSCPSKAQALLDEGYLEVLLDTEQDGLLDNYWDHMLRDYPDHPARLKPKTSLPITLYGNSDGKQ